MCEDIKATLDSLTVGDKVCVNDWKAKYTVCGVSQNFVLIHFGQHYSILSKRPVTWKGYNHNGVRCGDYVCAPDWWLFGYVNGYKFTDADWVAEYLNELEQGMTEQSRKKEAPIWSLTVVGHTDKVYGKKKSPP